MVICMYRNTYALINTTNIKKNVESIIQRYNNYPSYFGVVKADCYGHNGRRVIDAIIDGGCNYLCVSSLDEGMNIRKFNKTIPILCLGIINPKYMNVCIKNNITITISSLSYLKSIIKYSGLKAHLKINTGMNRLGINDKNECLDIINMINNSKIYLEGIYTHMYDAMDDNINNAQIALFEEITSLIDLSLIPIVHIGASDATMMIEKRKYANGCRLGICMYGLGDYKEDYLLSTFSLISEVIQINNIKSGTLGYSGKYKCDNSTIAVVPIGYADGIIRKNTGRYVYINDKKYPIVGNICMDMLFVKVDDSINVGDAVVLLKDNDHIMEVAKHLDTICYEVICNIGKRIPRIYE